MDYILYHGTANSNAENIIQTGKFIARHKEIHYLGQGIYFYETPKRAENWIKVFYGSCGVVLRANISVDSNDILDLRKKEHRKRVVSIVKQLKQLTPYNIEQQDIETNFKKYRCFLYDCISLETKCKLLISNVINSSELWALSVPDEKDLQYCVKDNSIITSVSMFREVKDWLIV